MGTRIRDKASNTDTSIILDSGTSYVKRDDQTVPVYRGITSTNLIGDLGGAPLYAPTFQVTSTGSQTFNITGWQSDYKCVLTGMECGYENRRVVSLAGARVLSDGACTVNYFEGSSNTNKTGTISLNTSTGVITTNNLNQFNLFVSVWDGLNAGVSATQTNLDAALARITQLENNAGGGGSIIHIRSGTESQWRNNGAGFQLDDWQTGDQVWIEHYSETGWKLMPFDQELTINQRVRITVSSSGRVTSTFTQISATTQPISLIHVRGNIGWSTF